ncbi:MAG: hypothetical protein ACLQG5_13190 [Methanobacterium sp.]|jgi:hypothetical protein
MFLELSMDIKFYQGYFNDKEEIILDLNTIRVAGVVIIILGLLYLIYQHKRKN